MIEVNLYSVPSADPHSMVGRCVARSRFNREAMGISTMEFVKGFLKENMDRLETAIGNSDLVSLINSDTTGMSVKDFMSISYCLQQIGFKIQIINVADDEENATGLPSGDVIEWNVIDHTFIQDDYPTATKMMPGDGEAIPDILRSIISQCGLFEASKFEGIKNPFTQLLSDLDRSKSITGAFSTAIVSRIYDLLGQMGFEIFCATSED